MTIAGCHVFARLFRNVVHDRLIQSHSFSTVTYPLVHQSARACLQLAHCSSNHSALAGFGGAFLRRSLLSEAGFKQIAKLLGIQLRHASISAHSVGNRQLTALRYHAPGSITEWGDAAKTAWQSLHELQLIDTFSGFARQFLRPVLVATYCSGSEVKRLLPDLLAAQLRSDKFAASLPGPSVYDHRLPADTSPQWLLFRLVAKAIQTGRNFVRLVTLMLLFTPVLLLSPLACYYEIQRPLWLCCLRETLEVAGPAFIKWGQWAATRHDIFPPDFCAELAKLQSAAPAHLYKHTAAAVRSAFGSSVDELFLTFDEEPLASGSIGQVHLATLSPHGALNTGLVAGTQVAVKVRHPGVENAIIRDFALMIGIAQLAELVPALRRLRLQESLQQFAAPLREQVDLALEGRMLWQFAYNFRSHNRISFPYPLYPLIAPEVLVETFEKGESISRWVEKGPGATHNDELARLGSYALLQMLLVDNLVHADLHPGNILVRLEKPLPPRSAYVWVANRLGYQATTEWHRPNIVLLDVGMSTRLTEHERLRMVDLFRAFVKLDGRSMARTTLQFSPKQSCTDEKGFIDDCDELFASLRDLQQDGETSDGDGAAAMAATLEIIRKHQVSLPGQVCAILVSILVLEGWSSKLSPQYSVLNQVERLVDSEEGSQHKLQYLLKTILWDIVSAPTPLDVKLAAPS